MDTPEKINRLDYDVIIVGSGIVGATAALALAQQSALKIAVLESQVISSEWCASHSDHRVSAISPISQQIFQWLDVWNAMLAKRVSPYRQMHVWDEAGDGEIHFDCKEVNAPTLGYIIENSVMRQSLVERFKYFPNIDFISPVQLVALHQQEKSVELHAANHQVYSARLLIAADGAKSWVREQAGIPLKTRDYGHTAIVATVQTEQPHQHTAWQRFLATGPLAFLPLSDPHTCSIVWSATHERAEEWLSLSDDDFCQTLTTSFANKLGAVIKVTERFYFPLQMQHAKDYVQDRIVLIGDAAHTIHPLAGQGVNLGLLDAIYLADAMISAVQQSQEFSAKTLLRRFERARKADNFTMLAVVDALKHLFTHQNSIIQNARNAGLNMTQRLPWVKNFMVEYALGRRRDLPEIIQHQDGRRTTSVF